MYAIIFLLQWHEKYWTAMNHAFPTKSFRYFSLWYIIRLCQKNGARKPVKFTFAARTCSLSCNPNGWKRRTEQLFSIQMYKMVRSQLFADMATATASHVFRYAQTIYRFALNLEKYSLIIIIPINGFALDGSHHFNYNTGTTGVVQPDAAIEMAKVCIDTLLAHQTVLT